MEVPPPLRATDARRCTNLLKRCKAISQRTYTSNTNHDDKGLVNSGLALLTKQQPVPAVLLRVNVIIARMCSRTSTSTRSSTSTTAGRYGGR